jgi:hypothetical protein
MALLHAGWSRYESPSTITLLGATCPVTHAGASVAPAASSAVGPSSETLPASLPESTGTAPSVATPFASSPAPDDDALEPLPPELALERGPAAELPELAPEVDPPPEELVYLAALMGPPVSLPQPPNAPSAQATPSLIARDEPRRFMNCPDPTPAEGDRRGQEFAAPVTGGAPNGLTVRATAWPRRHAHRGGPTQGPLLACFSVAKDEPRLTRASPRSGLELLHVSCTLAACLAGCFADVVQPGPYGSADDAGPATTPLATSEPTTMALPDADAGSRPTAPVDASLPSANPGEAGPGTASPCDLSGRWIATDHQVSTGLGAQEAAHVWYYLELSQTGSAGTVTKGLDCGENVRGISSVAANVDYPKTWPALLAKVSDTGRKFTSKGVAAGCAVSFEKYYVVLGATTSFYVDPSQTMPTASQQATPTTPGWEDWDNDGQPGFTTNVTGLVTGQIYMATRRWTLWSGTIAAGASTFKLADDWNVETDLLGYNGSPLLTSVSSRDNDASLHFVELARLAATQATGDDATTCTAIRSLAPSLTPSAAN